MRSIKRKFDEVQARYPFWSSYVAFFVAVCGSGFTERIIYFWFNRLVNKDEYVLSEKKSALVHLVKFSKVPEEGIKAD